MTTVYLDLEDLLALTRILGVGPVRDIGLLDSAAVRPTSALYGEEAYATVPLKAAALLHSIVRNHALVDGNKRLAWLSCVVILDLNDLEPPLTDEEAFTLTMDAAAGLLDVAEIADRLCAIPRRSR